MSSNDYVNVSVQLNEFGGNAEFISKKVSLNSYYVLFEENDIDNKLIAREDKISVIFSTLLEHGHVGILLDTSTVWLFYLRGNFDIKDVIISKWLILMKFPTQLPINSVVYVSLCNETTVDLNSFLTYEENQLLQKYVNRIIGDEEYEQNKL